MKNDEFKSEVMLTPAQAGEIFGVDPKTVTRWAEAGKIPFKRTLGGHRRFKQEDVLALRDAQYEKPESVTEDEQ